MESEETADETDELELEWREAGFTLHRPIRQKDGSQVERVEFREPCVGMLKVMDNHKGDVAKAIALLSRMTNLSPADVHAMHPRDYARCQTTAVNFFGEFLTEGGPSD